MEHFRRISVFVRVAELKSFAAASAALGLTPSAVSKSIAALERDLKVRLLVRNARGATLSEEGAKFFGRCKAILADLESAQLELGSARASVRGRLRVMLHVTPARFRILPELSRFLRQHPELQLEVLISAWREKRRWRGDRCRRLHRRPAGFATRCTPCRRPSVRDLRFERLPCGARNPDASARPWRITTASSICGPTGEPASTGRSTAMASLTRSRSAATSASTMARLWSTWPRQATVSRT